MKNAPAEWQHKEMLSASNTGGYFAVVHPNDTVRQGGRGSARYFVAGYGFARCGLVRRSRYGADWRGRARLGQIWSGSVRSGGQDLVRLGGARLGPVRSVQTRRSRRGVARTGSLRSAQAWRSGSGVARPGVMRSGVVSKAKTKVGGRADPSPSNKRKEEKWKKELIKYGTRMSVKR
jgi:hypothetical protein